MSNWAHACSLLDGIKQKEQLFITRPKGSASCHSALIHLLPESKFLQWQFCLVTNSGNKKRSGSLRAKTLYAIMLWWCNIPVLGWSSGLSLYSSVKVIKLSPKVLGHTTDLLFWELEKSRTKGWEVGRQRYKHFHFVHDKPLEDNICSQHTPVIIINPHQNIIHALSTYHRRVRNESCHSRKKFFKFWWFQFRQHLVHYIQTNPLPFIIPKRERKKKILDCFPLHSYTQNLNWSSGSINLICFCIKGFRWILLSSSQE